LKLSFHHVQMSPGINMIGIILVEHYRQHVLDNDVHNITSNDIATTPRTPIDDTGQSTTPIVTSQLHTR